MPLKTVDIEEEYKKDKGLKKEDVQALKDWADKQPHLPPMTELQVIIFLQSCYFSIEMAKTTIDNFYTVKTHCPEFFANRDPCGVVKDTMNVSVLQPLPKPTNDNYRVIYGRLVDADASKFVLNEQLKLFDMYMMLWLLQEGTQEGLIILLDLHSATFSHFLKLGVMSVKKFLYYLQDAMPLRLKGLHFINVVPFMDKILALMRPFMKKELMDVLYVHTESVESLFKFVPKECMPNHFGGTAGTIEELSESMKKRITENAEFFKAEEQQVADESKRPGRPKNPGDIFGVEGTFKKLDID